MYAHQNNSGIIAPSLSYFDKPKRCYSTYIKSSSYSSSSSCTTFTPQNISFW